MNFQDKIVLITGAGRGGGRVLAEAFAAQGARLALNDISPQNVEELAEGLLARGHAVQTYVDDIAKKVAVQALVNRVEEDFGRLDVLVNHAAVEPRFPLLDMDEWDWHRTLDVNLTGAFLAIQSAGRVMRGRGGGVALNLLSLPDEASARDRLAYVSSLFGLVGLTRQAARELAPYGIRVHALGRGLEEFQNADPAVPADLVGAVLFLAGPQAAHLNGQVVNVP